MKKYLDVTNQIELESVTGSFLAINEWCLHPIQLLYMKLVYILTYLFPKLKNYFLKTASICFLYVIVFIDDFEKDSEKVVQKLVWLLMLLDKIFTSAFQSTDMFFDKVVRLIFIEARMAFEFLFYETIMLTFELSLNRRLD